MKKLILTTCSVIFSGVCANSFAESDDGIYIGASVGKAHLDYRHSLIYDGNDTAYKVLAGYKFDLSSAWNLAIEASYRDFGSFNANHIAGVVNEDLTSIDLFAVLGYDWGDFGVFGKAGRSRMESDVDARNTIHGDYSATRVNNDYAFGLGARYDFGDFAVRAEYEVFNDVLYGFNEIPSMFTVGAEYSF